MNEITTSNNSIDNSINTITTTKKRKTPAKNKKDRLPLIAFTDKDKQNYTNTWKLNNLLQARDGGSCL